MARKKVFLILSELGVVFPFRLEASKLTSFEGVLVHDK
jgi:hypothetical protein